MQKKEEKCTTKTGERLKELLDESNMKDVDLIRSLRTIGVVTSSKHISEVKHGKCGLSVPLAGDILKLFPGVRLNWLMGYDDFKTEGEIKEKYTDTETLIDDATHILLTYGFSEVGVRDNTKPTFNNASDVMLMCNQLKDYAVSLAYNYLHREHSAVWQHIDQMNKSKTTKKRGGEHDGKHPKKK